MKGPDRNMADRLSGDPAIDDADIGSMAASSVRSGDSPGNVASMPASTRLDLRDLKSHLAERQAHRISR